MADIPTRDTAQREVDSCSHINPANLVASGAELRLSSSQSHIVLPFPKFLQVEP